MNRLRKARYDREYRKRHKERLRVSKAAYFKRTYDPIKAAKERKKRMPKHVKYCQQPWYKAWKREYDRNRRLSKFGGFAGAYQVLMKLRAEIKRQMPDRFERYAQAGRHAWNPVNQERRRRKNYERCNESFGS